VGFEDVMKNKQSAISAQLPDLQGALGRLEALASIIKNIALVPHFTLLEQFPTLMD